MTKNLNNKSMGEETIAKFDNFLTEYNKEFYCYR